MMNRKQKILALMVVALAVFGGCATTDDFRVQQQQMNTLQTEVRELRDQIRLQKMENDRLLGQTRDNLPGIRKELDHVNTELKALTGDLEVRPEESGLPFGERITLKQQLDLIRMRLGRVESKLGLKPLPYSSVVGVPSADSATDGTRVETPDRPEAGGAEDREAYNAALAQFEAKNYAKAQASFQAFAKDYPKSDWAGAAQFMVGESLYEQKKYEEAILEYQKVVKGYPKSDRLPNALLKQSYSFLAIGDKTSAKLLMRKIVREHPKSEAAKEAEKKLVGLN